MSIIHGLPLFQICTAYQTVKILRGWCHSWSVRPFYPKAQSEPRRPALIHQTLPNRGHYEDLSYTKVGQILTKLPGSLASLISQSTWLRVLRALSTPVLLPCSPLRRRSTGPRYFVARSRKPGTPLKELAEPLREDFDAPFKRISRSYNGA